MMDPPEKQVKDERLWIFEPALPEQVIGYVGPPPEGQATMFLYREYIPASQHDN